MAVGIIVTGRISRKNITSQFKALLVEEYSTQTIYPKAEDIFNALRYTDYGNVKAVILGQDPYPNPRAGPWALLFGT